jgi:hypothetical protein
VLSLLVGDHLTTDSSQTRRRSRSSLGVPANNRGRQHQRQHHQICLASGEKQTLNGEGGMNGSVSR